MYRYEDFIKNTVIVIIYFKLFISLKIKNTVCMEIHLCFIRILKF